MQISRPLTQHYDAMALPGALPNQLTVIAKGTYEQQGDAWHQARSPAALITASKIGSEPSDLRRENDLALFKTKADWHVLGLGDPSLQRAVLSVNGQAIITYDAAIEVSSDANLFGYEPVGLRTNALGPNTTATDWLNGAPPYAADLFSSTRRSGAYKRTSFQPETIPPVLKVEISGRSQGADKMLGSVEINLPHLSIQPILYDGGPDRSAYWCERALVPISADTFTYDAQSSPMSPRLDIVWRTTLDLGADETDRLRQLTLVEARHG